MLSVVINEVLTCKKLKYADIFLCNFYAAGRRRIWRSSNFCQMETSTQETSFKSQNISADKIARRSRKSDESSQVRFCSLVKISKIKLKSFCYIMKLNYKFSLL